MSHRRNSELDSLIAEITVDCYNDDEQLTAFEAAFDNDATLPRPGNALGEEVRVIPSEWPTGGETSSPRVNTTAVATKWLYSTSHSTATRQPTHLSPPTGAGTAADHPLRILTHVYPDPF